MKAVNMYIAIDENNKTIVISDIKKDIELKYKKYYCPNCKSEVIPKIGKIRSAHFAHKNHCCDLNDIHESSLHLMCKQILVEEKSIMLPEYTIFDEYAFIGKEMHNKYYNKKLPKNLKYYIDEPKKIFDFSTIEIEKYLKDIRPDIIIGDEKKILIEITVTHPINDEKKKKIKMYNYNVLEIDMSYFVYKEFTRDEIRELLVNSEKNKKWINYLPDDYKLIEQVKKDNEKIIEDYRRDLLSNNVIQFDESNFRTEEKRIIFANLENDNIRESIINSYRNDYKFYDFLKENEIDIFKLEDYPSFLDFKIKEEIVFKCDRRIWQVDLFYIFVYKRKSNFSLDEVINYVEFEQKKYKLSKKLSTKCTIDGKKYDILTNTIEAFFVNLAKFKLITIENGKNGKIIYNGVSHIIAEMINHSKKSITHNENQVNDKTFAKANEFKWVTKYFWCEACNKKLEVTKMYYYNEKRINTGTCVDCYKEHFKVLKEKLQINDSNSLY
ncbi:MAG: competence protein CoiA family protein [Candidatus Faecisoma sp.]|nr:hypothetical protein [Acholeplasma sp.]MDY2893242.1 competence protein CoiA family protein [Candidatus Faecisoma sp.]